MSTQIDIGGKCWKWLDGRRARWMQSNNTQIWSVVHQKKSYANFQLNMSKHVREKCRKLHISYIPSSKRGITPSTRAPKGHCRSPEYNERIKNLTSQWNRKQEAQRATYRAPEYNVPPFWQIGHICKLISPENTNRFVEFRSAVPVKFRWIPFNSFREKSNMSQPIRSWGGHFVFLTGPKNTNLEEDTEILLPLKFCWILYRGFRGEVENVSANQRPGRPSCFSDRPEKHKFGRAHWDLASCQVSLNSVQQFQRRSRICFSQSEARATILFFQSARKTQTS